MKRTILLIIIVYSSIFSNAQGTKITIGLASSYDFYNLYFTTLGSSDNKYEEIYAYNLGLRLQYNLSDKFSLRSGLSYYSVKGYSEIKLPSIYTPNIDLTNYFPLRTNYLSLPLMMGYRFFNKDRFSFYPSAGFIFGLLIGYSELYKGNWNTEVINKDVNKIILSAQINLGLEYNFNYKLYLTLEPYFNYGFKKMDDAILNSYTISEGEILSLNYKF